MPTRHLNIALFVLLSRLHFVNVHERGLPWRLNVNKSNVFNKIDSFLFNKVQIINLSFLNGGFSSFSP